jgi:hypothetical protein
MIYGCGHEVAGYGKNDIIYSYLSRNQPKSMETATEYPKRPQ